MPRISGHLGLVDGQSAVREWKINHQRPAHATAHSSSGGAFGRSCGVTDYKGWFHGYGHTPVVLPGDAFQFIGDLGNAQGTQAVVDGAIGERATIIWDQERGQVVQYRVDFAAKTGALTLETGVSATDPDADGDPGAVINCSEGLTVTIGGVATSQVRRMRLEMFQRSRPFNDSSTAGLVGRNEGTLDGRFSFVRHYDTGEAFPVLATPQVYAFAVGGGPAWTITWCQVESIEDFGPNREGQENVAAEVKGVFNLFSGTSQGSIVLPDSTEFWPTDGR
jgi:hypothetical protein